MKHFLPSCIPGFAMLLALAGCSGTDTTNPTVQKSTVRFYNGMSPERQARLTISGKSLGLAVPSGARGPVHEIDAATEPVQVFVDAGEGTQPLATTRASFQSGQSATIVVFPSTSAFEPIRRADSIIIARDTVTTVTGSSRLRVINATDAGTWSIGELGVYIDEDRKFSIADLPLRSISRWVTVEPGEHQLRVVREWQTPYDAATRGVVFAPGVSYTLFLSGTLNLGDSWAFQARLFSDNEQLAPVDLLIPPDVGSFQIVNAVTGIRSIDVKINGKIVPSMSQVPFPNATGYIDLDLGTHALEVLANSTPLVDNVRTIATLRSRKTMFVTGTLVPPNIVGIELSEPERAPNAARSFLRVVNLCPDAPLLDIAVRRDTTDLTPNGFRSLEFRESSTEPGGSNQFASFMPGSYTVIGYRAGTKDVVLAPADVYLKPGEVRTLWVGGLLSKISLYSVTHAK